MLQEHTLTISIVCLLAFQEWRTWSLLGRADTSAGLQGRRQGDRPHGRHSLMLQLPGCPVPALIARPLSQALLISAVTCWTPGAKSQ